MKWFKHFTDWHRDPDVSDGYTRFEHFTYVYLQCIREVFAEFFDSRDNRGYIRISLRHLSRRCRTRPGKFLEVSGFFRERKRIDYYRDGEFIMLKIIDFERLIGNWRQREDHCPVATVSHERDNEEEKNEEEKIYEEQKKEEGMESVAREILDYFNKKTRKNFNNPSLILSLLRQGREKEDFIHIIDVKSEDDFFRKNRRLFNPQTFFSGDHFEKYLQEFHDLKTDSNPVHVNVSRIDSDDELRKNAYFLFLKKEYASLQYGFIQLLRQHNLLDYLTARGFDENDYGFAVVSFEDNILRIFSASSFPGYTTALGKYLKEGAGIALEYVWKVPEEFTIDN